MRYTPHYSVMQIMRQVKAAARMKELDAIINRGKIIRGDPPKPPQPPQMDAE